MRNLVSVDGVHHHGTKKVVHELNEKFKAVEEVGNDGNSRGSWKSDELEQIACPLITITNIL